jgi:hypothetical protein
MGILEAGLNPSRQRLVDALVNHRPANTHLSLYLADRGALGKFQQHLGTLNLTHRGFARPPNSLSMLLCSFDSTRAARPLFLTIVALLSGVSEDKSYLAYYVTVLLERCTRHRSNHPDPFSEVQQHPDAILRLIFHPRFAAGFRN